MGTIALFGLLVVSFGLTEASVITLAPSVVPMGKYSAQTSVGKSPRPGAAVTVMPASLIELLKKLANTRYSHTLLGLHVHDGDTSRLSVTSNRVLLSYSNAKAVEDGGKYTPPSHLLADVVVVGCGDPDLGERFDCTRLAVLSAKGKAITPSQYQSGPTTMQNAIGARWVVERVLATYNAGDLADGFTVTYASRDTEWAFTVSAEDAERELLLKLSPNAAVPEDVASSKEPVPARLRVRIEPEPSGWRVTNLSTYPWTRCEAQIGSSKTVLPTLKRDQPVMVEKSRLQPPIDANTSSTPWIVCSVNDQTFIATKSDQQ